MFKKAILSACFLLSGATSLVLEIVWAKKLSFTLGNSLYGSSTVVAAFMAGLALGAFLARLKPIRSLPPIRLYAALQVAIAIGGFFSIPAIDSLEPLFSYLYQSLAQSHTVFLVVRFSLVFALVVIPVTLMGMTLPVVVEAVRASEKELPRSGGILYGLNTIGAFLGTLAAGYLLIPALGLTKTTWLIAGIDFVLAVLLLAMGSNRLGQAPIPAHDRGQVFRFIDLIILISGFTAIALEVVWFRFLVNVFGASTYALSNMLATYLVGIALGSLAGVRLLERKTGTLRLLIHLQLGVCFITLLGVAAYNFTPDLYIRIFWLMGGSGRFLNLFLAQSAVAVLIVLPPTLIFGAMFPAFLAYQNTVSHTVSRVYVYNTIGGILGSLLTGFIVLPNFGIDASLRFLVGVNMVLALALMSRMREPLRRRLLQQGAVVVCFVLVGVLIPRVDPLSLSRGVFMLLQNEYNYQSITSQPGRRILFQQEGINGSVAVVANEWGQGDLSLRVSSKPVAVTGEAGRRHLLLLGHLPMMFAENRREVAVVGYGTGITTGSVLRYPGVERVDVLELEKEVLAASEYFSIKNGSPLRNPKARVHTEDGRIFLTHSSRSYDVITSDPISPWVAGASSLYSADFYETIRHRLKSGGVFCQWLQMGDYASDTYRGVIATLRQSFKHVAIFNYGHDSMVLASETPIRISWLRLNELFHHQPIAGELAGNGIYSPLEIINFFVAGTPQIDHFISSASDINDDDSVWLEYQMAKDLVSRREGDAIAKSIGSLVPGRMRGIIEMFPGIPLSAVVEYLLKNPFIFLPSVHPLIYQDVLATVDLNLPLKQWYDGRATLVTKEERYRHLWESALTDARNGELVAAQSKLEELLKEVILQGYYQIGLEYIRVSMRLQQPEKALKVATRLQRMSPAIPHAYTAEIQITDAEEKRLEAIIARARTYIPDFVG
jgi:spermidine synthase